jgi:hypothetical protein
MTKQRDGGSAKENREKTGKKETADGMSTTPGTQAVPPDDAIGAGLKRIFDDVVKEPIPPEFLELLNRIDLKSD